MKTNKQAGFSLIEVLLSAVLLLILLAPLFSFLTISQRTRSLTIKTTEVEQNARAALSVISRDIINSGANLSPQTNITGSNVFTGLVPGLTVVTPIIPGNDLNPTTSINGSGTTSNTSLTDQITTLFVDQAFNNGVPFTGNLDVTNRIFTIAPPNTVNVPGQPNTAIGMGDFVALANGPDYAIGYVTSVDPTNTMITLGAGDPYALNNAGGTSALANINTRNPITAPFPSIALYKFSFITYFVDPNGNLIRRQQLAPPHTTNGGATATASILTYPCAPGDTCYNDNIIATGVENLQFKYTLNSSIGGSALTVDDPGPNGAPSNGAMVGVPLARLLDIRQVTVNITTRASQPDPNLKDRFGNKGKYFYRFTAQGTYSTRNIYNSKFQLN